MPNVYRLDEYERGNNSKTLIQVFSGPVTPFEPGRRRTLTEVRNTDGTIAFVEAAQPVVWTCPNDLEYDPTKPLPRLGSICPSDGFHIVLFDGSIQFVRTGVREDKLRRAIIVTPFSLKTELDDEFSQP